MHGPNVLSLTSWHVILPGTWSFRGSGSQFTPEQKSVATVLTQAGYHTAMFGKWSVRRCSLAQQYLSSTILLSCISLLVTIEYCIIKLHQPPDCIDQSPSERQQCVCRGIGGSIPYRGDYTGKRPDYPDVSTLLSNSNHNWKKPFRGGPLDVGFNSSFITMGGIQVPPYAYFVDDVLWAQTGSLGACLVVEIGTRTK